MDKYTEAAKAKQAGLEETQAEILAKLAAQEDNQLTIMEAIADLGMMVSGGGANNG